MRNMTFNKVQDKSKSKSVNAPKSVDLPGPSCYKNSCRFNCILYTCIGPTLTLTGNVKL